MAVAVAVAVLKGKVHTRRKARLPVNTHPSVSVERREEKHGKEHWERVDCHADLARC